MVINRAWAMPNSRTFQIKPIQELIERYINSSDAVIDPFANNNKYGSITNDLDPSCDTDYHMDATEFLQMLGDNCADVVLWDPPYCYDKDTELFTDNGWKNVSEITKEDNIATLNTETNMLEYHNPSETIKAKYKGKMIYIDSQSINLLVTPNHKCWVKNSFEGEFHWIDAKDLFTSSKAHWFQKACMWNGTEQEYFYLPEVILNSPNKYGEKIKKSKPIKMDLWLKFLGLYLSEGCHRANPKKDNNRHWRYDVRISQTKDYGRQKIKEVLDDLGYEYTVTDTEFTINDKQLWTYLQQFGKASDKFIPSEIKQLSTRQLNILIEYLMIGDGTNITYPKLNKSVNKMYHYTTNSYYTSSKKLMNDFCEVAIKTGNAISVQEKKKAGYNIVFSIHLLKAKNFKVQKINCNKEFEYDDYIYCITVPNSTVLVKRKGRIFWCGNSPRQVSECYQKFGMTVNMTTTQASYWSKQKEQIGRIIKPGGIVITCGWNSGGVGKKYGFEIIEILMVAHGGWHNDTIVTVERKMDK